MIKKYWILAFLSLNACFCSLLAATSSTSLGAFKAAKHHIYRCYGSTQPTQQDIRTLTYTEWWRCDGAHVNNQYITCPAGYVSVGVYTWNFTDMFGRNRSRCRAACAQVKAYIPVDNCRWENLASSE